MQASKIIGAVLLAGGILALVYGGFSTTQERTAAKIGSVELTVKQEEWVNVPVWAGAGLALVGGVLLAVGLGRR